jgi:hypothetical protein
MINVRTYRRKPRWTIGLAILALLIPLLAACAPAEGANSTQPSTSVQPTSPIPLEGSPTPMPDKNETGEKKAKPVPSIPPRLQPAAPTPEGSRVAGEVPQELLDQIIADLIQKLGVERSAIRVVQAEAVVWRDGSLGCPQPGRFYTQALVDGYKVVLEANNVTYDYHASNSGNFFLCQPRLPGTP